MHSVMANSYQPLATYGALADVPIVEARFRSGATDQHIIRAARSAARFVRGARGFESLMYFYDGSGHRMLAIWRDSADIDRFHERQREEIANIERSEWPDSPWNTHFDGFSRGIAIRHLMGSQMTSGHVDLAVPDEPLVLSIIDVTGMSDSRPLLELCSDLVPSSGSPAIQSHEGFMFVSACTFGNNAVSIVAGFRNDTNRASFDASPFMRKCRNDTESIARSQSAHLSIAEGRLLCWSVKQLR